MIIEENINGKIFVEQRTYYVYNSKEDRENDNFSILLSDEQKFLELKKSFEILNKNKQ